MTNFIRLNPNDNVLVALRAMPKGTHTQGIVLQSDISLAHKVAFQMINKGDDIIKYGMVIGRATADIAPGEHVHVLNLSSRYTATYYREEDVK